MEIETAQSRRDCVFSSLAAGENPCLIKIKGRELEQQFVACRKTCGRIGEVFGQVRQDHFAVWQLDPVEDRAPRLEHFPAGLNGGIRHGYCALKRFPGPGASRGIGKFSSVSRLRGEDLA